MNPWIETTGWTLIHFVWQGTLLDPRDRCRARAVPPLGGAGPLRRRLPRPGGDAGDGRGDRSSPARSPGRVMSFTTDRLSPAGRFESPIEASAKSPPEQQPLAPRREAVRRAANPSAAPPGRRLGLAGGRDDAHGQARRRMLADPSPAEPRPSRRRSHPGSRPPNVSPGACASAFRSAIVESAVVDAPILIGWLQPLVVLPLAAMAQMSAAQVEALVAHELAHIRRRDYAINLLQTIAEALLFFHPGVWWVSRRIRQEREHCCDDAAIAVVGEATAYAEALMALASWRERECQPSLGAAKGSLLLRIRRLLSVAAEDEAPRRGGLVVLGAGVALAAAVMVLSAASSATAQSPRRRTARTVASARPITSRFTTPRHSICTPSGSRQRRSAPTNTSAETCATTSASRSRSSSSSRPPISSAASQTGAANAPLRAGDQSDRILFRVDVPADQWLGLLTHEVAHVFGFDILPGSATPAWISRRPCRIRAERLGSQRPRAPSRRGARQHGAAAHVLSV